MPMVRREEPMETEIWKEPKDMPALWQAIPDEMAMDLPEDWTAQKERLFQLWCFTNGVNAVVNAFVAATKQAEIDPCSLCVVSGIGCLEPIYEALRCDCFHVHQGRSIPFAIGLHLANPKLKVVVLSDDSDVLALGGNHIIHAARRNLEMVVICLHNFEIGRRDEFPFNLPYLISVCGATYFSRWTILDWDDLRHAILEALDKRGFRFIEVIAPSLSDGQKNKPEEILSELQAFKECIVLKHFASPEEEGDLWNEQIVIGKFVDRECPTFLEMFRKQVLSQFG